MPDLASLPGDIAIAQASIAPSSVVGARTFASVMVLEQEVVDRLGMIRREVVLE
jgi:hypothetical protein